MTSAILVGLLEGLVIALVAVGVVLVYKADRFVNLANAQLGVLSSLLLAKLVLDAGVSWYVAFVVAVAVGVLVGATCRRLVIARIEDAGRTSLMIATLGLSQLLLAVAYFEWVGPDRVRLRDEGYPLPFAVRWKVGDLPVTATHVLIAVVAPTVLGVLVLWLRTSRFGRIVRAAGSNPDAARLAGIDTRRTSTVAWAITGGISAIGAVLTSPGQSVLELQSTGPTLLLVSLGAAALAGFRSLSGAVGAGVGLGVVEGVGTHLGRSSGAGVAAVFVTILVGLLVRSAVVGPAEADDVRVERSDEVLRIPPGLAGAWFVRHRLAVGAGVALAVGVLLPFLPWLRAPHRSFVLAHVAVFALAALSLTVLIGWAGQVSLGQFAFVAVGAFTAARLAPRGWSLLATILVAAVAGAVAGMLTGLPAVRSRGLTFAVTSLGLAVVGPAWLFERMRLAPTGTTSSPPAYVAGLGRLTTQRSIYFVVLVVVVVAGLAAARLRRSNHGRLIVAVRDNPTATSTLGFSVVAVRLATFAVSGALAGAAGVLWLAVHRNISVQAVGPASSTLLLAAVVIGGTGSVAGAAFGSVFVFGLPLLLSGVVRALLPNTEQVQLLLAGAGLLQTQLVNPSGIAGALHRRLQRILDRRAGSDPPPVAAPAVRTTAVAPAAHDDRTPVGAALRVTGARIAFDGVVAVDGVSLHVDSGEVVGIIGANGAGKTSLLDAICGLVPAEGDVEIGGEDARALRAARRARLGMSRGYQDARLFPGLTVRETVELAVARRHPMGAVGSVVGAPWARVSERAVAAEAAEVIDRFGLGAFAGVPCDRLSTGTRHLCDLATQVATRPRLMVLDEPTSGIAQGENEALRVLLRDVADEVGCAMLVVEHDMPFLMAIADRIYCLDRGAVIAEGTPAEVRDDPAVVAGYLGVASRRRGRRVPTRTR